MPDAGERVIVKTIPAIASIPPTRWDACVGDSDPFVSHAFLNILEQEGAAARRTGWMPCHLVAEDVDGDVLAVAPLYAKTHSFGEYVFDWSWADAWEHAGGHYYPKLQCAVPFTPVSGRRLLIRPDMTGRGLTTRLGEAIAAMAGEAGLSSAHVTFCTEDEADALAGQGWLKRVGEQYHWPNPGYRSFDDFLASLASRKRKAIRKERERVREYGLTLRTLSGDDIKPRHWDAFFRFYLDTVERKYANAYLPAGFFHRLGAEMGERVVLMIAEDGPRVVAGALNLLGPDALFGRNWGAAADWPLLHFELCYYRAIDFAIERKLARVEAGAQGEHKIARGYLPVATYSAHWIREAPLRRAVAQALERERPLMAADIVAGRETGPYRHAGDTERPLP